MTLAELVPEPETLLTWETDRLWALIDIIKDYQEIPKEILLKIKHGFNIKIPIWYIVQNWYEIYPTSKTVRVFGHGIFHLEGFMEEKDKRDNEMRRILSEIEDPEITQARVK